MERTGFVKEKKGDTLSVCFERPEACEGCRGCSKGLLPKKGQDVLKTLIHLICLVLFVVLTIYGIRYTQKLGKNATSLPIKMRWVFAVVPFSTCVMAWHALVLTLDSVRAALSGRKEAES